MLARLKLKPGQAPPDFLTRVLRIAEIADSYKAAELKAYDVRGLTLVADSFVLCSASSEPQMKALFNGIKEGLKEAGVRPQHTEGSIGSQWLILDYGDVIVHLFREEARAFYDLDGLWGDAPQVDLGLAAG